MIFFLFAECGSDTDTSKEEQRHRYKRQSKSSVTQPRKKIMHSTDNTSVSAVSSQHCVSAAASTSPSVSAAQTNTGTRPAVSAAQTNTGTRPAVSAGKSTRPAVSAVQNTQSALSAVQNTRPAATSDATDSDHDLASAGTISMPADHLPAEMLTVGQLKAIISGVIHESLEPIFADLELLKSKQDAHVQICNSAVEHIEGPVTQHRNKKTPVVLAGVMNVLQDFKEFDSTLRHSDSAAYKTQRRRFVAQQQSDSDASVKKMMRSVMGHDVLMLYSLRGRIIKKSNGQVIQKIAFDETHLSLLIIDVCGQVHPKVDKKVIYKAMGRCLTEEKSRVNKADMRRQARNQETSEHRSFPTDGNMEGVLQGHDDLTWSDNDMIAHEYTLREL